MAKRIIECSGVVLDASQVIAVGEVLEAEGSDAGHLFKVWLRGGQSLLVRVPRAGTATQPDTRNLCLQEKQKLVDAMRGRLPQATQEVLETCRACGTLLDKHGQCPKLTCPYDH